MSITTKAFGTTKNGEAVTMYTITNANNMSISVIDYGACLVNVMVPDAKGNLADVVLGYDDVAGYEENGVFFGSFIGRNSNRIGGAKFELNGVTYEVEKNEGENNLHGGTPGYHKVMYKAETTDNSVTMCRLSPDMEQGFPGNMDIRMTYTLTDDNEVKIHYYAKSDKDTICNLTNHSYFNLKGHNSGTIEGHELYLKASGISEVRDDLIPTGVTIDVTDTPMDFRTKKVVGSDIDADYPALKQGAGYDHNYCLDKAPGLELIGEVTDPDSGRTMEMYTDLPGIQFYSGNYINNVKGKEGAVYGKRAGFCFETQYFPNCMNIPEFENCVLKAGEEFDSTTIYKFVIK
ncbi:MAG: galactose mutarotase [Eubacterium sp.]|nr:galactose mutarotase [Eubacterium sp.]